MSLTKLTFCMLATLFAALPARALTIDTFGDSSSAETAPVIGSTKTVHVTTSSALGGGRSFSATRSGAGGGSTQLTTYSKRVLPSNTDAFFLGFFQGPHAGSGSVTWDGDTDASSIKPDGLGGVDLTQDGGTAFKLGLESFDYPSNLPVFLKIKLFDSSKPNGSKFSEIEITINQRYSNSGIFDIVIPFTMFSTPGSSTVPAPLGLTFSTTTTFGAGGAVDVTRVGAISLAFRGDSTDLELSRFETNGRCSAVPDSSGKAIDECSLCHENPDSKKGKDRCGICYAGPLGYSYETNKIQDACGLCPGEVSFQYPSGITDKCGTCLGGPPPYTYVDTRDACGVCGGTTTKKANCTVGANGCPLVQPTAKILGFEKSLTKKASLLRDRYQADVRRAKVNRCAISFAEANKRVGAAFSHIKNQSEAVFRQGVEVCKGSCVTVSYAQEVKALTPFFKVLEVEASSAAKLVQQCYKQLGINKETQGVSPGETARTVAAVRNGLGNLIRECRRTSVCKKK